MQKIKTFLWFDSQAEDAANFYVSIFNDAKILRVTHYGSAGPGAEGSVMTVDFQLFGQDYTALNGGPLFTFNESISLEVNCDSQDEIDEYWTKLTGDGGQPGDCGWLKDKYGLSWQIVPAQLVDMISDPDQAKGQRVMAAMLTMKKMDMAELRRAYDQG